MSKILYTERMKQLIDFNGMDYGKIYPTDIDGMIEYKNIAYLYYEVKYGNKEVPFGQKLALERLVEDARKVGKKAIAIVAEHDIEDVKANVILADCNVREVYLYYAHKWIPPEIKVTVRQVTDLFMNTLK